jgi:phospho-N-acetylmuramoyl-pentapeptide-transferase
MTITAGTIYPILLAFALSVGFYPVFIPYLRRMKVSQSVRDDGPQTHLTKAGTPTMGGLAIVFALIITSIVFLKRSPENLTTLIVTAAFAAVGCADDALKVVRGRSLGLTSAQKFTLQAIVALAFCAALWYYKADLTVIVPFSGITADLGYAALPLVFVAVMGTVNGANFTDGLDGLAAGVTALIAVFFLAAALALKSPLVPVIGAAAGALLGFLLFNSHPAKVFMGDTGSLALGAFVACVAVYLNMTLFIVIVAFVYMAEVLSVMIQVGYFKLTHGKRIFKMAPVHHHFEKMGWAETKVVAVFYIATAVLCLIGFLGTNGIFDKLR